MAHRHSVRGSLCILLIATCGTFVANVVAAPADSIESFSFSGQIVNMFDSQNLLGSSGIQIGADFSGSMSYDSSVPNQNPTDPNYGFYQHAANLSSLVYTVGNVEIRSGPTGVAWEVLNDFGIGGGRTLDGLLSNADNPTVSGVNLPSELDDFDNLEFFLQNVSSGISDVFVDTSLPSALDLGTFNSQRGFIWQTFSANSYDFRVEGIITSLDKNTPVPPVPEPGIVAMMSVGISVMIWATRKKKRQRRGA